MSTNRASDPRLCVIIPAYNEARFVANVVRSVRLIAPAADIVVINDGSTDGTAQVARLTGATVLSMPFNLGIGGAVQTGIKYADRGGYDLAIEVDADGQHDPAFIPKLVAAQQQTGADLIIGSRYVAEPNYRQTMMRSLGMTMFSFLIRLVKGKMIYDSTSGFRVYSRRAIELLSRQYPSDFPEPESIVILLNRNYTIREVSVVMHQRQAGVSSIQGDFSFRAAYFVISNSIAILLSAFKQQRQ